MVNNSILFSIFTLLSVSALNNKLTEQPEFLYDDNGKITGYKSKGGADAVFPFSTILHLAFTSIRVEGNAGTQKTDSTSIINTNGYKYLFIPYMRNWYDSGQSAKAYIKIYGDGVLIYTASNSADINNTLLDISAYNTIQVKISCYRANSYSVGIISSGYFCNSSPISD